MREVDVRVRHSGDDRAAPQVENLVGVPPVDFRREHHDPTAGDEEIYRSASEAAAAQEKSSALRGHPSDPTRRDAPNRMLVLPPRCARDEGGT
ncbi:MAG TPA: hypothetical protein VNE62_03490, partial [Actinomycetota bacterium]|nr:hypothetical protein [Actinomycetota bacterium]